jgi:hypothetical protein
MMVFFLAVDSHRNHSHDVLGRNALRLAAGAATAAAAVFLILYATGATASRSE